ncbi:MAG: sigma 54-interacting transcriptional regulator [Myxococcota bacterium]
MPPPKSTKPEDLEASGTRPLPAMTLGRFFRGSLVVTAGPNKDLRADLDGGALVIGTSAAADLVLTDDTVSGRHAELWVRGDRVYVRDLGSKNGVQINGVRVLEAQVEPSMSLRLGNTSLRVEAENKELPITEAAEFLRLVGASAAMRAIFAQIPSLAASNAPLLIEGETGTGKDRVAEAIHEASPRADGPLVVFDCGAVAASLVEAELFGHEKRAFTGAEEGRVGLVEAADGGTLVLDEIGELPLELQPKLLRLVERREIRRVGSTTATTVDVRIIACTHRSLRAEVKATRFREDLFFRLSALRLRLPALRERPDDIPVLVDRLLAERGSPRRFNDLSEDDRALLLDHRWPGNVRELRNAVERLLAAVATPLVENDATAPGVPAAWLSLPEARERAQDDFEKAYVRAALARANGNATEAAKISGVSRQFLQRLIKKHGIR